jgi:uncharacterized protein (TIGR02246 family)
MSSSVSPHAGAADKPSRRKKADPPAAGKDSRQGDRARIQSQREGFLKAFQGGDSAHVASFWTNEGELIGDDGTVYRGRAAIANAYRELFSTKEKRQAEIQQESLRFPSRDTAIEEGTFKVRAGRGEPTASRYSILHVREGDKWLMAVVREWPTETVSLRDLDWLIGTWAAKREDTEVSTTYEWMWSRSFIRMQFTIRQKDREVSGFQMIGKDAASGELRSWTFESEGGFGEASWSRDGNKWVLSSRGYLSDGTTLTATNVLTPVDQNTFTWQAIDRSVSGPDGGAAVEDLPPVRVSRVKQKK